MLAFLGSELLGLKAQVSYLSWWSPVGLCLLSIHSPSGDMLRFFFWGINPHHSLSMPLGKTSHLCVAGRGLAISWLPGEHGTRPNQHIPSPSHSDWCKRRHKTHQSILVKHGLFHVGG